MAKERFKITPLADLSNKEAVDRFVVELNATLEGMSTRLPSVNRTTAQKLNASKQSLSQVVTRRPGVIPPVVANPVDLAALKDDLEQKVMAAQNRELAEMKLSIDTLANALSQVVDLLVD